MDRWVNILERSTHVQLKKWRESEAMYVCIVVQLHRGLGQLAIILVWSCTDLPVYNGIQSDEALATLAYSGFKISLFLTFDSSFSFWTSIFGFVM